MLSTVHSAKGLEWDAVHVLALSDGLFPSDMALDQPTGLEEERRLFYVALTRARRQLHSLRADALPPPPAREGRRPRLRHARAAS